MIVKGSRELLMSLQEEVCGNVTVHDAEIEIIEIILENPWGAVSCPPHSHSWFEFNYIYEGTMRTGFGGPMLDVGPGEFFVVPPGIEHSHEYVADAPHYGVCLRWKVKPAGCSGKDSPARNSIYERLSELGRWTPGCYPDRYGLGEQLQLLFREAEERCAPASIQLTIVKLLLALASLHHPQGRLAESPTFTNATFLRKIEIYLDDERQEQMNVHRLAASLHTSYHHLARKYKQLTGKTVTGRLTEIRMQRAARLLTHTDESISAIAEKTGFATVYYFSRVFKNTYGVSPREYRNSVR